MIKLEVTIDELKTLVVALAHTCSDFGAKKGSKADRLLSRLWDLQKDYYGGKR